MDFARFLWPCSINSVIFFPTNPHILLIQWFSSEPIFSSRVPFPDWKSTFHCKRNTPFWFHMLFIVNVLWEKPINWAKLSSGCGFFSVDPCPKGDELNCSAHYSWDLRWTEVPLKNEAQVVVQALHEPHVFRLPAGIMAKNLLTLNSIDTFTRTIRPAWFLFSFGMYPMGTDSCNSFYSIQFLLNKRALSYQ